MKKFKLLFAILLLPLFMVGQVGVGYVKRVQNALKSAEAARDEAVRQKDLAIQFAKAGNCAAAKEAAAAAAKEEATAAAAAAAAADAYKAAYDAAADPDDDDAAAAYRAAAYEAAKLALLAAKGAFDAAENCKRPTAASSEATPIRGPIDESIPDPLVKSILDALASFEQAKKDFQNSQASANDLTQKALTAIQNNNCDEAKKLVKQVEGYYDNVDALKNTIKGTGDELENLPKEYKRAIDGMGEAQKSEVLAQIDAMAAFKKRLNTGYPKPVDFDAMLANVCDPDLNKAEVAKFITQFMAGGGIGAAQTSTDVGYCFHKDGVKDAPENSTPALTLTGGWQISKKTGGGTPPATIGLDSPHNPYASFASYRPSASGNAGSAPVTTAEGGKLDLMSLNLGVSFLHLKGEDRYPERGASFDKKMVEVLATGDFYFINLLRAKRATRSPKLAPFLRLGAGFGVGNPNTVNGEKGTKKTNFALPMGLGFRVNVSDKISLNLDYMTRATFSDALDGVTSSAKNNDWYGSGGLGLSFLLGKNANDNDGDGVKNDQDPCPNVAGTLGGCPDTDGDGLADREDTCPNEAGDQRFGGCPDTDGDGVTNNLDDCPDDAGLRRFAGCPDTDGDNIIDKEDRCPTVAGLTANNGCPDADRDGVNDDKDECPNSPGPAEQNGCPDTDNDGIVDSKDDCPRVFGPAKFNGCPDSDGDGLSDNKDKCPNLNGPASNQGCPEIDKADKLVLDKAMRNVKFRTNSAELLPSSIKDLEQIAEIMSRYKGYKLSIDGYTDNAGPVAANQSLSEARAKACYDYLSSVGVRLSQMTYAGHGPTNPIGDNNTEEGRLKNRRVEFTLTPQ